jgi:hypothetical protein
MPNEESVTYFGYIDGVLTVMPIDCSQFILSPCSITVEEYPDPVVEYIGDITSEVNLYKETSETDINGYLDIENSSSITDIDSTMTVLSLDGSKDLINGSLYLQEPDISTYDIINGNLMYESTEYINDIFESSMIVPSEYIGDIDSNLFLDSDGVYKDIPCKMEVNGISNSYDLLSGTVSIETHLFPERIINCDMRYEKGEYSTDFLGFFNLSQGRHITEFPCQLRVNKKYFIYSIYSKMNVVGGCTVDIPSSITVFNDQIYDIDGSCIVDTEKSESIILEGTLELPPYKTSDIDGTVSIDRVDTRKEFPVYMRVVVPIITDIPSTMTVQTVYHKAYMDILSSMNVGYYSRLDIPSTMTVLAATRYYTEFNCSIHVHNDLMPSRIGIFVDPLWQYEPFVVKASLVTFLDRVYTKNTLKIIYGGNPRANWDIHHFADVFSVRPDRQVEVPIDFDPRNPIYNRNTMWRFINVLCSFDNTETHRTVDRVFIFSNQPYTLRGTMITPLVDICQRYRIPCVCITSKGEFVEQVTGSAKIMTNTVDSNIPIDQQPHWSKGPSSKHRYIYDTNDITD